jgi:hypothetical protein
MVDIRASFINDFHPAVIHARHRRERKMMQSS